MLLRFSVLHFMMMFSVGCLTKELPSFLPRCYLNGPGINDCILNATWVLRPQLQQGIKELRLPSFKPLVTEFGMSQQDSPIINYTIYFWNFTMQGVDEYNFKEIHFDPNTLNIRGKINFPSTPTNSICEVSGDYLNIHTHTKGPVNGKYGPAELTFQIIGDKVKRKNKDYYEPKEVKINLAVDDFKVNVMELFGENTALGLVVNELLDINSRLVMEATAPSYASVIEAMWLRQLKWLAKKYPYTVIFPIQEI